MDFFYVFIKCFENKNILSNIHASNAHLRATDNQVERFLHCSNLLYISILTLAVKYRTPSLPKTFSMNDSEEA